MDKWPEPPKKIAQIFIGILVCFPFSFGMLLLFSFVIYSLRLCASIVLRFQVSVFPHALSIRNCWNCVAIHFIRYECIRRKYFVYFASLFMLTEVTMMLIFFFLLLLSFVYAVLFFVALSCSLHRQHTKTVQMHSNVFASATKLLHIYLKLNKQNK